MVEHKTIRRERTTALGLATALLAFILAPGAVRAQEPDDRWLPFSGCWQPVGETAGADTPEGLLCFQPVAGDSGVELVSFEDGAVVGRETVRADGQPHDAKLEGCTGWERADFSARAGRVFLSSEYECDGGVTRTSTGLLTVVSPEEWVDVKVVTSGGERLTWVTRYRLATPSDAAALGLTNMAAGRGMAVRSSRAAAAARPSVEDLIEATQRVDSEGVQTWLAERNARLDLDSEKLIRLADAGVPEEVIDMAIAVSFPQRFAVDGETERYGETYDAYGRANYYDPLYGSRFYSPYGFGYGYGYGYGYRGRYVGPRVVRVDHGDSGDGGRVVRGQGYRRGGNSSATRSRPTSTRGSSAGRSSRGSSRGKATGRTAKRRGGGF